VVLGQARRDPGGGRPLADLVVDDRRAEQNRQPGPALEQHRGGLDDHAHQEAHVGVVVDDEHPDGALNGAEGHVRHPI